VARSKARAELEGLGEVRAVTSTRAPSAQQLDDRPQTSTCGLFVRSIQTAHQARADLIAETTFDGPVSAEHRAHRDRQVRRRGLIVPGSARRRVPSHGGLPVTGVR